MCVFFTLLDAAVSSSTFTLSFVLELVEQTGCVTILCKLKLHILKLFDFL